MTERLESQRDDCGKSPVNGCGHAPAKASNLIRKELTHSGPGNGTPPYGEARYKEHHASNGHVLDVIGAVRT